MGCICSEPVWNIEANIILRYLLNDHEELKLMQRRISICIKRGVGLFGSGSFFCFLLFLFTYFVTCGKINIFSEPMNHDVANYA